MCWRMTSDLRGVDAQSIVTEIAKDEYNHVAFLRTALGAAAVPMPLVRPALSMLLLAAS